MSNNVDKYELIMTENDALCEAHDAALPQEVKDALVKVITQGEEAKLGDVITVSSYYFREGHTIKASRNPKAHETMSLQERLLDSLRFDSFDLLAIDIMNLIEEHDLDLEERDIAEQIFETHVWMGAA